MKNYRIKTLLLCAALSLVVVTFVYVVRPVPITLDLAKSIPSSIESSLTAIPDERKLQQADLRKTVDNSNQSHSKRTLQAIEKHAYRNHPDSGTVLRNVPLVKPLPDSDTFLAFSDFDSEFEPWAISDQDSGSILRATLDVISETARLEKVPQIGENTDELAGIATQP